MDWRILLQQDVQQFIHGNIHNNVRDLALKKSPDASWPYSLILDQIKVRQKAKTKSEDLYETDGFIFPANEIYEQASSSACAAYKSSLVSGDSFIDLTGGCGVDGFAFARSFKSGVLVECDKDAAVLLEHNSHVMSQNYKDVFTLQILNQNSMDVVQDIENIDFIYIDPARRTSSRKGVYDLNACSPDIISILDVLKMKAKRVMIKTSPVLDIEKTVHDLRYVVQIHVVQWQNECKEVLYILDFEQNLYRAEAAEIISVAIDNQGFVQQKFEFILGQEKGLDVEYGMPEKYIYEPGPAFQKSGGFKSLAIGHGMKKLHAHTHLYTSDYEVMDFPGKCYELIEILPVQAKLLQIKQADLAIRNFPGTVENLRKKLRIKDGGKHRIFATTLADGQKRLLVCRKWSKFK